MLKRNVNFLLWNNFVAPAGAITGEVDVSVVEFAGAFVEVSAATAVVREVLTVRGWREYDRLTFTAAGSNWINIWSAPYSRMRFRTTAAVTITVEVWMKT